MIVKVKYRDILAETEKAVLLLISEKEVWFPRSAIRFRRGFITCPQWLAEEKDIQFTAYIHFPKKIEAQFGQEAIDELRYHSGTGHS